MPSVQFLIIKYPTNAITINSTCVSQKCGSGKTPLNGTTLSTYPGYGMWLVGVFLNKNFLRQFRLHEIRAVLVGQVCSAPGKPAGACFPALLTIVSMYLVGKYFPMWLLFFLCFYVLFMFCFCEFSGALFLLLSFLHFVVCLNMCRAKSIVHWFVCWFNFCDCMCICLLASFFTVVLWSAWLLFIW